MLQGEHSAILPTFIKLPFLIKIFVLSNFEWLLKTRFTVGLFNENISSKTWINSRVQKDMKTKSHDMYIKLHISTVLFLNLYQQLFLMIPEIGQKVNISHRVTEKLAYLCL